MNASMVLELADVTAWEREVVATFDRGRQDILIVERPPVQGISEVLATARLQSWRSMVTAASADERVAAALDALRITSPVLAEDIVALSRSFLAQFGVDEASLRVEVVNKQSCPKFHCDNVRVRLVTTYHGPTTEYVHAADSQTIRAAPLFALVFLKGCQHPGHANSVHHRSPEVPPGSKRLCVILDV